MKRKIEDLESAPVGPDPETPDDRVKAIAAKHRETYGAEVGASPGGETMGGMAERLKENLEELAASPDPDRHSKACDLLLAYVGDDAVKAAFNAIPRHL